MTPSGPNVRTRGELRAYLVTVGGRHYSWPHLSIRHNSVPGWTTPCRFCDGAARPEEGPALFWDADPLCDSCAAEIAPELALYITVLRKLIRTMGGNWRALGNRAA